jgi:hypothetical protein
MIYLFYISCELSLFIMGVLSVKRIKYIRKKDYTGSKEWQTIKLPVIEWIALILIMIVIPVVGGFISYQFLDCHYIDIYCNVDYYCEKSDLKIKIDRIITILSKPFNWLFYKI